MSNTRVGIELFGSLKKEDGDGIGDGDGNGDDDDDGGGDDFTHAPWICL